MHSLVQLIAAALLFTASAQAAAAPVVEGNGVGKLRVGMSVKAAKTSMPLVSDRTIADDEGGSMRSMHLRIGVATAEAEVVDGKVFRVSVRSPTLRTARGFGVGTKLNELLREPGWEGGFSEGYLFVWNTKYCGLSFELNFDPHNDPASNPAWNQDGLASLPPGTRVKSILVRGCNHKLANQLANQ